MEEGELRGRRFLEDRLGRKGTPRLTAPPNGYGGQTLLFVLHVVGLRTFGLPVF